MNLVGNQNFLMGKLTKSLFMRKVWLSIPTRVAILILVVLYSCQPRAVINPVGEPKIALLFLMQQSFVTSDIWM